MRAFTPMHHDGSKLIVGKHILSSIVPFQSTLKHHVVVEMNKSPITSTENSLLNEPCSKRRNILQGLKSFAALPLIMTDGSKRKRCSWAITPEEASSSYDEYASTYDDLDGGSAASILGIDQARTQYIQKYARGENVLEIGVGTGLNLDRYDFSKIGNLTCVDISAGMLLQAQQKVPPSAKINFLQADATTELSTTFEANTFDTVVDTFSLCVMGNDGAKKCLQQIKRIVKSKQDGGRILLIENARSSNPVLGWYQDATAEAAAKNGGKGCLYNQDVASFIRQASLEILQEESFSAGLFRAYVCARS